MSNCSQLDVVEIQRCESETTKIDAIHSFTLDEPLKRIYPQIGGPSSTDIVVDLYLGSDR